jgi:hypothetical protein
MSGYLEDLSAEQEVALREMRERVTNMLVIQPNDVDNKSDQQPEDALVLSETERYHHHDHRRYLRSTLLNQLPISIGSCLLMTASCCVSFVLASSISTKQSTCIWLPPNGDESFMVLVSNPSQSTTVRSSLLLERASTTRCVDTTYDLCVCVCVCVCV